MPGPALPPHRRARAAARGRAGAGLAASAAAHLLLALLLLARLAVPPAPPDIPAEVELVLGGGGAQPGDAAATPPPPQAAPVTPPTPEAAPVTPPADAAPQADATPPPDATPPATPPTGAPSPPPAPPAAPPPVRVGDAFAGLAARLVDDGAGRFRAAQADGGNLPPRYPRAAGRRAGSVTLRMHVAPDGRVARVELLRSSGTDALDRSAADALARWRFTPALRDGAPVADEVDMTINFRLD